MATLAEIIDYVTTTPQNINPNVLRSLLENSDTEDEDMPADAVKSFSYEIGIKDGSIDGVTVAELNAMTNKNIILHLGTPYQNIQLEAVTDDTNAFEGNGYYTSSSKSYSAEIAITKEGAVTITSTELTPVSESQI